MNKYIQFIILVAVAIGALYLIPRPEQQANEPISAEVVDFHTCSEAGGQIMESYPARCTYEGKTYTEDVSENPEVIIDTPKVGDLVKSPVVVKGRARGNWFFEANLPVKLTDQTGKVLAQKGFQANGEWMTTDYVEFEGTLEFSGPTTEFGIVVIEKDNASGLPEHDAAFAVPVRFR